MSIGNRVIDSEHKKLYDMINRVAHSIAARNVAALSEAFELLESCLCDYSSIEGRVAQAVNFDFTQHRLAHQHMLDEVRRIRGVLVAGNCVSPEDEHHARCLMDCLIKHIKEDGRPLKLVLDTHLYDFNP